MPVTSVRDLVVHGDDLAVATHGRGFWVLDQMSALRELAAKGSAIEPAEAYLFAPGETFAISQGSMNGTPLPHEEPQELNPPAGVLAYYWLKSPASSPVKLELLDAAGLVRACAASDTPVKPVDTEAINVQAVWMEPPPPPSAEAGMHRFALGAPSGRGFGGFGGAAAPAPRDACSPPPGTTPPPVTHPARQGGRRGPVGLEPGSYTIRMSVDGQTYTQPVTVKPDPRGGAAQHPSGEDWAGKL
jgi:hypothetical protein